MRERSFTFAEKGGGCLTDTKERILLTALQLFARDGYEAVSVSDIALSLGMTKGALYKHYRNKRDIFDSILARMEQHDAAEAQAHALPEGTRKDMEDAYRDAAIGQILAFSRAMFRFWTRDAFASCFRKMLTLEQYRSAEMGRLYQQYLGDGPLGYMTDLFTGMGLSQPRQKALLFYGPMYLLYSISDAGAPSEAVEAMLDECMESAGKQLMGENM